MPCILCTPFSISGTSDLLLISGRQILFILTALDHIRWSLDSIPLIWWLYHLDLQVLCPWSDDHIPLICWSNPLASMITNPSSADLTLILRSYPINLMITCPIPRIQSLFCSNFLPILAMSYLYRVTAKYNDLNYLLFWSLTQNSSPQLLATQQDDLFFNCSCNTVELWFFWLCINNPSTVVPALPSPLSQHSGICCRRE